MIGLASFSGVARRQEVVGEFGGVTVIDDFAHHPTAVAGTLAAMTARYPGRRLWVVFEPRSNTSRRHAPIGCGSCVRRIIRALPS